LKTITRYIVVTAVILAGIGSLVGLTWINYRYSIQNPGGSDFLIRWVGTREFLMTGQSPYSEETTLKIQEYFYERAARPGEDQVLFIYPFYSIFIFAPFALIPDYPVARAVWMTTLEVGILLLAMVGISLSRWKPAPIGLGFLLVFSILNYYSIRPLINANISVLIGLFIFGAILAIRAEQDSWAGFLLAFATIKPQIVALVILFILIWAISERRYVILWSFLGYLALLFAITSMLIPDWTWQNLRQFVAYPGYADPGTPGEFFINWVPGVGKKLGWALTIVLIATLIWEWRSASDKNFRWFLWTAYLTLAATALIGIPTATENYVVMLPAVILVFAAWDQEWGVFGKVLIVLSYIVLLFGVWWLFLATLKVANQPMQSPIMFFPLPVFLLIGLYWIRWWVLRPERPLLDQWRDLHHISG
jgi:hypothetical protein